MSRVTVIIPTYNRAYILGQAIESVLAQTMGISNSLSWTMVQSMAPLK